MSTPPWGEQPPEWSPPPPPPPPNPYGQQPPPGSPYQPYGAPGSPYSPAPANNGLAIASMVVSLVSVAALCCYGIGGIIGIVGAILGHVARKQIREQQQAGDGMALAGVIVGWIAFGIGLLVMAAFVVLLIVGATSDDCYTNSNGTYVCD